MNLMIEHINRKLEHKLEQLVSNNRINETIISKASDDWRRKTEDGMKTEKTSLSSVLMNMLKIGDFLENSI